MTRAAPYAPILPPGLQVVQVPTTVDAARCTGCGHALLRALQIGPEDAVGAGLQLCWNCAAALAHHLLRELLGWAAEWETHP